MELQQLLDCFETPGTGILVFFLILTIIYHILTSFSDKDYCIVQIKFMRLANVLFDVIRLDNNNIMVENYGENVQDRPIPKPVRTFDEAYGEYRKSLSYVEMFIPTVNFILIIILIIVLEDHLFHCQEYESEK